MADWCNASAISCDESRVLLPNLAENEDRAVAKGIREAIEESSFSDSRSGTNNYHNWTGNLS